ncbi:response regulator VieB [Vibrio coralliilyticus]|uniref:response regulator n=1 Tax=Vibrio coralliilyticus TaxID=190893 RepID=UPI000810B4C5|nr:response regulator [Vibrio coralliilyticus]ANW26096.1 response regulator VieB [Vibrio coralliilyticus]
MIIRASNPVPSPHHNVIAQFRVLVVDESTLFAQSIKKMLMQLKVDDKNITHASDTKLAAKYLRESKDSGSYFDVIICSFNFKSRPQGREFFRYLEKEQVRAHLTALIITDNAIDIDTVRQIDAFLPDGFIAKPFNHNQFLSKFGQITEKALRLKPLKNAYFQKRYHDVLELTQDECLPPKVANDMLRLRCLSLIKLDRFEEAVELCQPFIGAQQEWPSVLLIELYSLQNDSQKISDILYTTTTLKDHPRVHWVLNESQLEGDDYQYLLSHYAKVNDDHEKSVKAALVHLLALDYDATLDSLGHLIRSNKTNPLLDKRLLVFLQGLVSLNSTFENKNKVLEVNDLNKIAPSKESQHQLYFLFVYILKHYDRKSLFLTGQRIDAFFDKALYAKDNLVLILLALACYQLGLYSKLQKLYQQKMSFIEKDYLAILTSKILGQLVQMSDKRELYYDTNRDDDLSALVSMTHSSPLNTRYHEGFISQLSDIVKRRKVKRTKEIISHIESSIAFLKDSYESLGLTSDLMRLRSEYELIKINL